MQTERPPSTFPNVPVGAADELDVPVDILIRSLQQCIPSGIVCVLGIPVAMLQYYLVPQRRDDRAARIERNKAT